MYRKEALQVREKYWRRKLSRFISTWWRTTIWLAALVDYSKNNKLNNFLYFIFDKSANLFLLFTDDGIDDPIQTASNDSIQTASKEFSGTIDDSIGK